jgi:hypothetical protein
MRPFFEGTRPGRVARVGTAEFDLPVLYFRDDSFGALFTADLARLRAVMPSRKLHPVPHSTPGRGLVYIGCFDYLDTSIGPYGEVAVAVPAVYGRRPPPVLPTVFEGRWPGFGAVILHLPVTTRLTRDGGRAYWGYAKFVADMRFQSTPEFQECRLDEGGKHVLTLHVVKRGPPLPDRRPLITYSVKDGALIRTTIPQSTIVRTALGAGGASLELGGVHPVAISIRELGIDLRPVMTRYYLDRSAILPEGEVLEQGVGPLEGYPGAEREEGELLTTHLAPVPSPGAPEERAGASA